MPDIAFLSGEGDPRLVVLLSNANVAYGGATTFTATSANLTAIGTTSKARVGMKISSWKVIADQPNKLVWGKATAIAANSITIDAWVGGTPTNGQDIWPDGWVIDMPKRENEISYEEFTRDQLVHKLYRNRKASKFYGYEYFCRLGYESMIEAEMLYNLSPALNMKQDDKLILIPRADRSGRGYNVIMTGKIKIANEGERGHKFVAFQFEGTENVSFPIPDSGYGFGYATNYGHQL